MQCKLTFIKMTQNSTYLLLHRVPYKSAISSWQPPRYFSELNFLQMETGCQLVPKMFSVTFLSGFCPQTIRRVFMYKAIGKKCLLSSYLSKKFGVLVASFRILGRFSNCFFFLCNTWSGQMMVLSNFRCRAPCCFG